MKNLNEFCTTYRYCPFCNKELILRAQRSVLTGIPGYLPEISVENQLEEILLTYESNNTFNKGLKLFLDSIIIDKFDNLILYLFTDPNVIKNGQFDEQLTFLLNSNQVTLYMSCLCPARYSISLKSFKLDNGGIKLVNPELFSEYFQIEMNNNKQIEIVSLFTYDKTKLIFSTMHENGFPQIVYETSIPLVNFNFSNKEDFLNRIKTFINYS